MVGGEGWFAVGNFRYVVIPVNFEGFDDPIRFFSSQILGQLL